jgi:hypothetical protein
MDMIANSPYNAMLMTISSKQEYSIIPSRHRQIHLSERCHWAVHSAQRQVGHW